MENNFERDVILLTIIKLLTRFFQHIWRSLFLLTLIPCSLLAWESKCMTSYPDIWRNNERDTAGSPERYILPARVANHNARFYSSCSLSELAV